ncbi:hypothetical protein [Thiothrix winogradskyi]|uniref:Uncharacterized protein n=1 Tax=Thiothrix winogradskyi TaxID=96472 RepID=A0ABY3SVX5_9GAMM|nr:hypothetical protein [Thiothrix winogradskyi]UJS23593.1 hypothetical protein L2Y54_16860 [Thiothrix winogradskyi]
MDTVDKLLRFSGQIPAMQQGFKDAGFLIPDMMLSHIENMRVRGSQEKSYAYYKLERTRERMGFWGMDMEVSGKTYRTDRKHSRYQSEYISWLIDTLDSEKFNLPHTGSYEAIALNTFDPNGIRDYQFGFENFEVKSQYILALKNQQEQEIRLYQPEIDKFPPPDKVTLGQIRQLLDGILFPLGFEGYSASKFRGRILHRKLLDDDIMVWHEYADHAGMSRGGGDWTVFVKLAPPNVTFAEIDSDYRTQKYFVEDMPPFLFTGKPYYARRHEGNWNQIVFGALAHAKMLGLFFEHWEIAKQIGIDQTIE